MRRVAFIIFIFIVITALTAFCQENELETRVIEIEHALAQDIFPVVEHLKSNEGKVSVDVRTNSIIIVDHPVNIEHIKTVIDELDKLLEQVEIKVVIADVTDEFLEEIGMRSGELVIPSVRFDSIIALINESRNSNVRSEMTVRTLNNQPAKIQATAEEIFGYAVTRHGRHWHTVEPLTREAGDMLEVTPRVSRDGTIMVTICPSASAFNENGSISEKTVLTQVLVKSGQTLAIGSVGSAREEKTQEKLPLLGTSMSRTTSKEDRNVVMFLTATVVE